MGQYLKVRTTEIKPSQDFLKEGTVEYILRCYVEGKLANLPPSPIARRDPANPAQFIAIDGHNLIAIKDLFAEECEIYVAEAADDFIDGEAKGVRERNRDLENNFGNVIEKAKQLEKDGILSFSDLRRKYSYLESLKSAQLEMKKNFSASRIKKA